MPLIIDNNRISDFSKSNGKPLAAQEIFRYIHNNKNKIRLAICRALMDEIKKGANMLALYAECDRLGILVWPKEEEYTLELNLLSRIPHDSNDLHILALARATSSRLLYSDDTALIKDFKNKLLIDNPRGKAFQSTVRISVLRRLLNRLGY